ncbi:Calcium-dependent lipid-binding (CaLB domain) family protein [Striga hermonthica]|uniref:Calcium-dependent lipid-binding (CaLB domain) family protein n=1 Tax=Striga hermonthica TaxID=68872 RepID=A0A9N7R5I3_STRHE|nr:Calcium-dependent lipid-binding (CaLB domain) family protein [Striga hermonthica]
MWAPPSSSTSLKLLELNIMSAHDLPPVSKMLRTFAVAYISPDHKLTTRIDHTGHTSPTWNYKVAFHVDDLLLKSESSAVTIEIYNLAWLRDLPIGTCRLMINSLSKNPGFRRVDLQVCRPSGHLQGTLHVGVQLVAPPRDEFGVTVKDQEQEQGINGYFVREEEDEQQQHFQEQDNMNPRLPEDTSPPVLGHISRTTSQHISEAETRTIVATSAGGSFYSVMRPLPSEVAADLKRGLYSAEWNDYGSSVFEGWTEKGDKRSEELNVGPTDERWPVVDDPIVCLAAPAEKRFVGGQCRKRVRTENKKKGLFSCFGNAYGFQFSIFCGSKPLKKKKKKGNRNVNKQNIHLVSLSEDNRHRYYV